MKTPTIDPESESEILRASTILLIRLGDVTFGPWVKEEQGDLMVCDVTMQVIIEEVLKGKVSQNLGEPFELKVQQRGTGGLRVMDYYGLWSHVTLAPGVRFVAFCPGASDDATILLTDDNCEQLVQADMALEDTKAALELEAQNLSAADILARAASLTGQRGDIFARYVLARTKPQELTSFDAAALTSFAAAEVPSTPSSEALESLMKILEDPKTTAQARASYLTSIYEALGMMASPPRQWEVRLVQAMLKLLALPEATSLHPNIREVYLPNLLGLDKDPPRFSAEEVFKGQADDRSTILSTLKGEPPSEFMSELIQWLEGKDS